MANQIETNLFEDLSDEQLQTVVGGSVSLLVDSSQKKETTLAELAAALAVTGTVTGAGV